MTKPIAMWTLCWLSAIILAACSDPEPLPEEKHLLTALKNIQSGFRANMSANQFDPLLTQAKQSLDTLGPIAEKNPCFFSEAKRSYASFEVCKKALRQKETAMDEKRKIDMETTLSFTLGFASVSLAKASECLNNN